eukprot:TCALIF_06753-PA protein Name:"Similar to Neurochondrin Neurochondrin homolog (Drosophila melanogaster)" AED:0.06 eAED:0.07 QI:0/0.33/0.28/0.85/0.83/0.85/7/4/777
MMNKVKPVRKCLAALAKAETDTERLAALFLVPKLVKGQDCDKQARLHLMKLGTLACCQTSKFTIWPWNDKACILLVFQSIGYSFLARMLRSKDSPEGCPGLMYQSVALAVLSCFTGDEEIMTNASILFNLPILLDIINDADNEIYEENLLVINDAYEVITAIVSTEQGRNSFISNRGIHTLCDINIRQSFQSEKALTLLLSLLKLSGSACWSYHQGTQDFNNLMTKFCEEFYNSKNEGKFELCHTLRTIIRSFPKSNYCEEAWLPYLQSGLRDILFSKITKEQRDPALMLLASVIEVSDFEWCICGTKEVIASGKFVAMILNLSFIEVIMHLEEKKLEDVVGDLDLVVSCYFIIESGVSYMANERLSMLDDRQKGQLYSAMKNVFSTVLKFLHEVSLDLKDNPTELDDNDNKAFICATIRILASWLAEETTASRDDVCAILPFIFTLSNEAFEAQKVQKLQSLPGKSGFGKPPIQSANEFVPDVLRFLLPALCHLIAEDKSRQVLLTINIHEQLYAYLVYHWSIFECCKDWVQQQDSDGPDKSSSEPTYLLDNAKFDTVNSKFAICTICNSLMNLVVLEPHFVDTSPMFGSLLKFLMNALPTLQNSGEYLVLYGNICVLGLLILKEHSTRPSSSDFVVFKFIQCVVRFLWDAHNTDQSPDGSQLTVSQEYKDSWNDASDLWFLGVQVTCALIVQISWIKDFVVESGWAQSVIENLVNVKSLEEPTLSAFEDLLVSVAVENKSFIEEMKTLGVIQVCQNLKMRTLAQLISKGGKLPKS